MPQLEAPPLMWELDYLVGYLFEVGPSVAGNELTHSELRDWQHNSGVQLDDFGALALKQMSRAYLGQYHAAQKPDCPYPVQVQDEVQDEQAAADREAKLTEHLRATLMAMASTGDKKQTIKKGKSK